VTKSLFARRERQRTRKGEARATHFVHFAIFLPDLARAALRAASLSGSDFETIAVSDSIRRSSLRNERTNQQLPCLSQVS